MRAEGEVGVQLDTQDFRGSVQRGYLVSYSQKFIVGEARNGGYQR